MSTPQSPACRKPAAGEACAAVVAFAMLLTVVVAPASGFAAGASRPDLLKVGVLAIAPFADEASLSRGVAEYGAARLGDLLKRSGLQIVESFRVAEEMKRLGMASTDLISPTRTVTVGTQVGADAVLTGRVTLLMQDSRRRFDPFGLATETRVDVDIRILQVGTRLILFQDDFSCVVSYSTARAAMECVVRDVASRLLPARN